MGQRKVAATGRCLTPPTKLAWAHSGSPLISRVSTAASSFGRMVRSSRRAKVEPEAEVLASAEGDHPVGVRAGRVEVIGSSNIRSSRLADG